MFPPAAPTSNFRYRVHRKIGEGGMGEVYQADDLDLGRRVAIKAIKPSLLTTLPPAQAQLAVQRFLQEARAAAALTHPGATTVYRVGSEEGCPFIVMEWLDGSTLEAVLAERERLPLPEAVDVALQILAVLDAAHAAGIVHRDIKPANIMLAAGRVKVTDFGIARMQGASLAHTQAGSVLGTPHYAAPEQLAGHAVDCRADIYALGAVLYEAVVGQPPFDAPNLYELLRRVHGRVPLAPSVLVPGLSAGFDDVVLCALAKRPEDRFSSAREMAAALAPFAHAAPRTSSGAMAETLSAAPSEDGPFGERPATRVVEATTARGLVTGLVREWPLSPLPAQDTQRLLARIVERPLHAAAFSGAVELAGACILVADGVIYAAFDPMSERSGDSVIEALPANVDATLHPAPESLDPRVVPLLASLLLPPMPRLSGLNAAFTDVPRLADTLAAEGFDGALRFTRGSAIAFVLFSRGRRILEFFGSGWPEVAATRPWESWINETQAITTVEDRRVDFPAITFRAQLAELVLDVVRPARASTSSILSDTRAEAHAIELRPRDPTDGPRRRGESTVAQLLVGDPALGAARWVLTELAAQFEQFGRTAKWRELVEPLARVHEVRLHHALPTKDAPSESFDAVTYDSDGDPLHAIERASLGTKAVVERFVARVTAVKSAPARTRGLCAAILFAPSFTEDGLAAYLAAVQSSAGSLLAALDAFSHREGYLRLGLRSGVHVLLVEDDGTRRRPLVPS